MSAIILALSLWASVPDDCDPIDFIHQPRIIQDYMANSGYLVWMHNCLMQQELRDRRITHE